MQQTPSGRRIVAEIDDERTVVDLDRSSASPRIDIERDGEQWRLVVDSSDSVAELEYYDAAQAVPEWLDELLRRFDIYEMTH